MKRALLAVVLLAGCKHEVAPPPPPSRLGEADRASVQARIATIREAADRDDAGRRAAVAGGGALVAGAAPCAVTAKELLGEYDLASSLRSALTVKALGSTDLFFDGKAPSGAGPARKRVDAQLDSLASRAAGELAYRETAADLLARVNSVSLPLYTLSLVVDQLEKPRTTDDHHFVPGSVRGRLFLWSHAESRNICAAPLDGESSDSITVHQARDAPKASVRDLADPRLLGDLLVPSIARGAERLVAVPAARP